MDETVTYDRSHLRKHIYDYISQKQIDEYVKTLPKKPKQEPEVPKIGLEKFFNESKGE